MRFRSEFSGQWGCSMWWDLDKDTGSSSWGSLGEGNWAPLAGTLGVMQCCCWDYIWSTSSRSQVHYMSLCEAEESWQRWAANLAWGVQGSSQTCHMAKVPKRDKPAWSTSRHSEFMRSFCRGVRGVRAAWQYDRASRLGPGSEGWLRSAWLSPARQTDGKRKIKTNLTSTDSSRHQNLIPKSKKAQLAAVLLRRVMHHPPEAARESRAQLKAPSPAWEPLSPRLPSWLTSMFWKEKCTHTLTNLSACPRSLLTFVLPYPIPGTIWIIQNRQSPNPALGYSTSLLLCLLEVTQDETSQPSEASGWCFCSKPSHSGI